MDGGRFGYFSQGGESSSRHKSKTPPPFEAYETITFKLRYHMYNFPDLELIFDCVLTYINRQKEYFYLTHVRYILLFGFSLRELVGTQQQNSIVIPSSKNSYFKIPFHYYTIGK